MDLREELFKEIQHALYTKGYDAEMIRDISNIVISKMNDYEITERTTELAVNDAESYEQLGYYISAIYTEGKSKNTIEQYKREIVHFYYWVGKPFNQVTANDIRRYLAETMQQVSDKSAQRKRSYLSPFFRYLKKERYIAENPMDHIKKIKTKQTIKTPFTDVDIDSIRSNCKSLLERCVVELALSSGARADEICQLNISDIDFQKLEIIIRHAKGGKCRTSYISGICAAYLKDYLNKRKDDSECLFINRYGNRLTAHNIGVMMRSLSKRSGVPDVHAHRFRHTLATNLFRRGVDIAIIQQILGHENISTTVSIYTHIEQSKVRYEYGRAIGF